MSDQIFFAEIGRHVICLDVVYVFCLLFEMTHTHAANIFW